MIVQKLINILMKWKIMSLSPHAFREALYLLPAPWKGTVSVYECIRDNPDSNLPDDEEDFDANKIRFAPGALDGMYLYHMQKRDDDEVDMRAQELIAATVTLLDEISSENLQNLYRTALQDSILPFADRFIEKLFEKQIAERRQLLGVIGRYFASKAPHREAVKFGLLLLELAGEPSDIPTLETLARHDEFSLYAAIALSHLSDNRDRAIWNVALKVHSWGRVLLVEKLEGTKDAEIQAWMLREGFRNDVMNSYIALICANTGGLKKALQLSNIDKPLLDGAAELFRALTEAEGPVTGLEHYADAPDAMQLYLDHAIVAATLSLEHFFCARQLLDYFSLEENQQLGSSPRWKNILNDVRRKCQDIINRPEWIQKVETGLRSKDSAIFFEANQAASLLNIATRSIHLEKVLEDPLSGSWYELLKQTDDSNIDEIIELASRTLPLSQIATGPGRELDMGPKFAAHRALDWVLQDLKRFPKKGWVLLKAGLQSPVIRNRHMALNALDVWPREFWPHDALAVLREAVSKEPEAKVKSRLEEVIASH